MKDKLPYTSHPHYKRMRGVRIPSVPKLDTTIKLGFNQKLLDLVEVVAEAAGMSTERFIRVAAVKCAHLNLEEMKRKIAIRENKRKRQKEFDENGKTSSSND